MGVNLSLMLCPSDHPPPGLATSAYHSIYTIGGVSQLQFQH